MNTFAGGRRRQGRFAQLYLWLAHDRLHPDRRQHADGQIPTMQINLANISKGKTQTLTLFSCVSSKLVPAVQAGRLPGGRDRLHGPGQRPRARSSPVGDHGLRRAWPRLSSAGGRSRSPGPISKPSRPPGATSPRFKTPATPVGRRGHPWRHLGWSRGRARHAGPVGRAPHARGNGRPATLHGHPDGRVRPGAALGRRGRGGGDGEPFDGDFNRLVHFLSPPVAAPRTTLAQLSLNDYAAQMAVYAEHGPPSSCPWPSIWVSAALTKTHGRRRFRSADAGPRAARGGVRGDAHNDAKGLTDVS